MEYIEGQELKDIITNVGAKHSNQPSVSKQDDIAGNASPLSINQIINITIEIAEGLQAAHDKGIIHRDIKPANIMIIPARRNQVKIMDFGLAKMSSAISLTQVGTTLGTIAYMSPEQTRGDVVDYRTDIWSLGVVLYEMIAEQLPFKEHNESGRECERFLGNYGKRRSTEKHHNYSPVGKKRLRKLEPAHTTIRNLKGLHISDNAC